MLCREKAGFLFRDIRSGSPRHVPMEFFRSPKGVACPRNRRIDGLAHRPREAQSRPPQRGPPPRQPAGHPERRIRAPPRVPALVDQQDRREHVVLGQPAAFEERLRRAGLEGREPESAGRRVAGHHEADDGIAEVADAVENQHRMGCFAVCRGRRGELDRAECARFAAVVPPRCPPLQTQAEARVLPGSFVEDATMLSPAELRAALPFVPSPPPESRSSPFGDDDADRVAETLWGTLGESEPDPPTAAELLDAASRTSPLLGAVARGFLPIELLIRHGWVIAVQPLMSALQLAIVASFPAQAGTTAPFGAANIAVSSTAIALVCLALFYPFWKQLGGIYRTQADLRRHQLALLWRWQALANMAAAQKDGERPSTPTPSETRLLRHAPGNAACPCPLPECAGSVGRQQGLLTLGDFIVRGLMLWAFGVHVTPLWTPMVAAGVLWRTWWGALLGTLCLAVILFWAVCNMARVFRITRPPVMGLSSRLICRAVALQVRDVLDLYRRIPEQQGLGQEIGYVEWDSLYAMLDNISHALASNQAGSVAGFHLMQITPLSLVPAAIMNLAAGGCVPLWELATLLWYLYFTVDALMTYAAANARIGAVSAVLRDGADAARALAIRAADADVRRGGNGDPALRSALEGHAARLEARAGRWAPARFVGVEVTYGTVRALVATLVTVAFAIWGMLRGLGVTVVLESYCYA
ncbi:hypothetical protein DFJ74DRAFT_734860 [Hyaloraphidium curvatum]|nr:hypothetical protein DFJ74DRAFT_734860 [Hyaloraphidium curvatum]